jgi:isopropylmalate/homocitrate/citramalate synthase
VESNVASKTLLFEDTTLREGEQTPGVVFSERDKLTIVSRLLDIGVRHIEIGIPVMGGQEERATRALVKEFPNVILIGWNRGVKGDLAKCIDTGVKGLHIGLPSSDVHLNELYGKSHNWVVDTASELIDFAKSNGISFISVSAEDMGRANLEFLCSYAKAVALAGATRLRLSDTVGCLRPDRVSEIVRAVKTASALPLQLHMHNDFGLAVANVLAGVQAGAEQVHTTINGLGERAGITAFHQVVLACDRLLGCDTGIRLDGLRELSDFVSRSTGLQLPHNEPILGARVFTHESGIHVTGLLQVQSSFEPFPPAIVGRTHEFVLGKHSGSQAIVHLLTDAGMPITRDEARELLSVIREFAVTLGGLVPVPLAVALARQVLKQPRD